MSNSAPEIQERIVIIGADPASLATARALSNLGVDFDIYEKHRDVGGIWDPENSDSPMPEDYPDYPSAKQILGYIRAFTRMRLIRRCYALKHLMAAVR